MILEHQHFDLLGKVIIERVVFNPPLRAFEAMHDEACLVYAVNGNSIAYSSTEKHQLQTDESVLVKCGNFLNHWQVTADTSPSEAIAIHFYPEVLKLVYENQIPEFLKNQTNKRSPLIQKIEAEAVIKHYIDSLLFYFKNPNLATRDLIILKVKELILLLYNTNSHGIRQILADLFNPNEVSFKEIIKANLFNDLTGEEYAKLTNLSLSSFKRKFKSVFDATPAKYIKNKRLERAEELLKISNLRVTDICFESGFNDLGTFSKSFVKKFGTTPSNYQKKFLNEV